MRLSKTWGALLAAAALNFACSNPPGSSAADVAVVAPGDAGETTPPDGGSSASLDGGTQSPDGGSVAADESVFLMFFNGGL